MALCIFVYVRFEAMDYSDSALQLLTQYLSAGSEWSLYYGRRMAESTGVLLSRIIISLIRGCRLHEDLQVQYSIENCACGIYRLLS